MVTLARPVDVLRGLCRTGPDNIDSNEWRGDPEAKLGVGGRYEENGDPDRAECERSTE